MSKKGYILNRIVFWITYISLCVVFAAPILDLVPDGVNTIRFIGYFCGYIMIIWTCMKISETTTRLLFKELE